MAKSCIIIGGSHAGGQAGISLRQSGYDGDIVMVGDEPHLPYHRPPLSKDFLSGGKTLSDILIRGEDTYERANIQRVLDQTVTHIDPSAKTVTLESGFSRAYDTLILATGARARPLPIPGADLPGVYYLRSAADVLHIQAHGQNGQRAVIIGGGYIGLETAASLTKLGVKVTVLEMADRILQRVTAPVMSDFYRRVHTEEGVDIRESASAANIVKDGDELCVSTNDGNDYPCDFVIVGIGVIPNTQLAESAGLAVGNGIEVDEFCQTSQDGIYAIGDVTWHHNPLYGTDLRLESVPNATEQAKIAAQHICGKEKAYSELPWFWSDQFDLKLQIAGLSAGFDDIVMRGDPNDGRSFAAFYFKGKRLLAVDAINRPQEFMVGRRIIPAALSGEKVIDKTALADESVALKTFLK